MILWELGGAPEVLVPPDMEEEEDEAPGESPCRWAGRQPKK